MYKNLQFKIVVIFVVFTIAVITSVGGIMLHRTVNFYDDEFMSQMRETFGEGSNLVIELREAFDSEDSYEMQNEILKAYASSIGVDKHRNYYVLDINGNFKEGSDKNLGSELEITPNIVSAMNGEIGAVSGFWSEYIDYAVRVSGNGKSSIIYVKDTQEEVRSFTKMIFIMTIQAMLIALAGALL